MKKAKKSFWTREKLKKIGVPGVLIPGIILAVAFGWQADKLLETKNYYQNESIFPKSAVVKSVIDGDNLQLENGLSVRLIGINAPERGKEDFDKAKEKLDKLATGKKVYLEYDRYQDDSYGRILAWVWVNCEDEPKILQADYMYLNKRQSRPGLTQNPEGCQEGKLINEEMLRSGLVELQFYKDRGELKYEARLTQE